VLMNQVSMWYPPTNLSVTGNGLVYHVSINSSFPLSLLKGCRGLITFQHFVVCIITKVCGPKTYTRGAAPTSPRLSNTWLVQDD
jgi:hypothetical protein